VAGPAWLTAIFAAVMVTVAAYCSGRLIAVSRHRRYRRTTELDTDATHIVMGVAMAGMLVERLRILPAGAWEAVFAAGAAWFAWRLLQVRRHAPSSAWRCRHPMPHAIECAAMLYMFLVLPASLAARSNQGAMGGMSASSAGSRFSLLALVLALFMFGYVVWLGDRLSARAPALAFNPAPHSPERVSPSTGPAPAEQTQPAAMQPVHPLLAPRCAALCQIAMGLTMGYMLIMLL
jgi:hypothetical protein